MLKKLNRWTKAAVGRIAHYALGIQICERRIKHFEKRLHVAEKEHHPELEVRARKKLSYWRIRQTKLVRIKSHWKSVLRERRKTKKKWLEQHPQGPPPAPAGGDWVMFDGHECPKWMVEEALQPARDSGEWKGEVFSGRRSPEYCEELCFGICGAPSCSGTCAGRSSNHCGPPTFTGEPNEGAADVTDPYGLRHWAETHGNPIRGGGAVLPADLPHFSREGN